MSDDINYEKRANHLAALNKQLILANRNTDPSLAQLANDNKVAALRGIEELLKKWNFLD